MYSLVSILELRRSQHHSTSSHILAHPRTCPPQSPSVFCVCAYSYRYLLINLNSRNANPPKRYSPETNNTNQHTNKQHSDKISFCGAGLWKLVRPRDLQI